MHRVPSPFVTQPVVEDAKAAKILESLSLQPTMQHAALRGIADETTVYEFPDCTAWSWSDMGGHRSA